MTDNVATKGREDVTRVLEKYVYDRASGQLYHRRPGYAGLLAGTVRLGYRYVFFDGRQIALARVVWLLEHEVWPVGRIRYRDKNKLNTRIGNLYQDSDTIRFDDGEWTEEKSQRLYAIHAEMRRLGVDPYSEIWGVRPPANLLIFE